MSKGSKPPPAPDYLGVAKEQGNSNLEALRIGAALNRVSERNPYGSTTYRDLGNDQWEQVSELSPEQQKIFSQQQGNQYDLGRIANMRLSQVGNQGAFSLDGLPQQATGVAPSQFKTDINAPSVRYNDLDTSTLGQFGNAGVQRSVDFSGAPSRADARYQSNVDLSGLSQLPGQSDFGAERQRVEDAVYGRASGRLDEQFGKREQSLRTQLLNQGITEGSEAWANSMRDLDLSRQDAYGDARDRAIQAGGAEQSRLFGDSLRGRQQGASEIFGQGEFVNSAADRANSYGLNARGQATGESLAAGQFGNQAADQFNSRADAQRAQRYGEILQGAEFGNDAAQTNFANEMARLGLYNQAEGDRFSQGLTNAGLQNQGRATALDERLLERDAPLREFMSLYNGGYQNPLNPGAAANVGSPEPADMMGANAAQYGAQSDIYNWGQARNAQNTQAGMSLAQLAAMIYMNR